jgi:upstream activation factor subunit UAF30
MAKTAKKTAGKSNGKAAAKKKPARKPNAAFMKPVTPSADLAQIVGAKPIPRTEVTKKLWAYIKKNGLQDAKNKRMIKADAPLKTVFGGKAAVNMFEMTKLVGKHLK